MPAALSTSEPFPIPAMGDESTTSYREIIKQIASQAPKPYGAIPPLLKKRKKKSRHHHHHSRGSPTDSKETGEAINLSSRSPSPPPPQLLPPPELLAAMQQQHQQHRKPMRRMSHVEDWIEIDSKESLPDEEELVRPFSDFFTQVLPLHSPPPSLSDPTKDETATTAEAQALDDEDEDEDDDDSAGYFHEDGSSSSSNGDSRRGGMALNGWKSEGEEDEQAEEDNDSDNRGVAIPTSSAAETAAARALVRRHSISSFSKAGRPSTSTSASYAMSTSPPREDIRWAQTIAKLRRSLVVPNNKKILPQGFIPMPPAPRRPTAHRRRSEATTQPRFNPDTNTYTRDTRSNPDHLRIIACELNMIRTRKLLSPLKPRGFLPRRKDPFVRGEHRRLSALQHEWLPSSVAAL